MTRAPGYVLAVAPERVDAGRFTRLQASARASAATEPAEALRALDEALALWRGPAYADFADEPFTRAEAARLEELRLGAMEVRSDVLLRLGRHGEGVGELATFAQAHPSGRESQSVDR